MALAKKCDVCGVLYEDYDTSMANVGRCNGIAFIHKGVKAWNARQLFDCCPDCFESIQSRIKELKEKENA